ncbi:flagellin [Yersinia kristensenii]|uniref:flagellin N-terminal helical domain-containing protein n=1 Tax=Yersinia kristensenii TaxID=28152 RepID=UPI00119D63EC|nr:flagellin [Yersinia kristensenii]
MGLSINDQSQAFIAAKALNKSQSMYNKSTSQLSTGLRILSAKDDAAGSQIAAGLNAAITGQNVALRNNSQSSAMLEAANGALAGSDGILNRMKELATQAANATNGAQDRAALNAEFKSLGEELKSTLEKSTFGDGKLFATDGKLDGELVFQTGASAEDVIKIDISAGVKGLVNTVTGVETKADATATTGSIAKKLSEHEEAITKAQNVSKIKTLAYEGASKTYDAEEAAAATANPPVTATAFAAADHATTVHSAESVAYLAALPTPVTKSAGDAMTNGEIKAFAKYEAEEAKGAIATAEFRLQDLKDTDLSYRAPGLTSLTLDTAAKAQDAITKLTTAISDYSSVTASLAAGINRLGYSSDNLTNMRDGNMAAKDSIMNADAVAASTAQNTAMLLMNSGIKALSKNTQMGQMVAQLF